MVHIGDCLVSEDVLAEAFCCDLSVCKGNCCNSEGESGAPLDEDELEVMKVLVDICWDDLTPRAQEVLKDQGPYFRDKAGDYVASVVEGRDCVFCTYSNDGMCLCAIEKAFRNGVFKTLPQYREGKEPFVKPVSCHLYPVRLKNSANILQSTMTDRIRCADVRRNLDASSMSGFISVLKIR